MKNKNAQELVKKRWSKTTETQRKKHSKKMHDAKRAKKLTMIKEDVV